MIKTSPTMLVRRHTPAPWSCGDDNSHNIYGPPHPDSKHPNGKILIGVVYRGSRRADPGLDGGGDRFGFCSSDDVRLICAAPLLLEIAQNILLWMEEMMVVIYFNDDDMKLYHNLRGVIRRAGGFSQDTWWWQGPCKCSMCGNEWQGVVELPVEATIPQRPLQCSLCHEMEGHPNLT